MKYRLKLMICISLLIALTFGIGGAVLIGGSFDAALEEQTAAALDAHQAMQQTVCLLLSAPEGSNREDMTARLHQIGQGAQAVSLVLDGEVLYQSRPELLRDAPDAFSENTCAYIRIRDEEGYALLSSSTVSIHSAALTLTARYDLSAAYSARDTQLMLFGRIYGIVVLLGLLTAAVLSYGLTRRLDRLTAAVRQISGGDLAVRTGLASDDEFGQLSRDFDAMADNLRDQVQRLETEVERQEAFIGAFAHEMKTPMTSIIGYADLLRQDKLQPDGRLMAADYIFSEGQRLERLSRKLLDLLLLGKEEVQRKEVRLPELVGEVKAMVSPGFARRNLRFVCTCGQGKTVLEPDLVKSLLYNLLDNAAKAIDGEGTVRLTGTVLPGGCQFRVEDTGRGMEPEELSKITEAFYRVDKARSRKQGGVGLGLSLCREIVRIHRGHMHFESVTGEGTRVTVTLYGEGGKGNG